MIVLQNTENKETNDEIEIGLDKFVKERDFPNRLKDIFQFQIQQGMMQNDFFAKCTTLAENLKHELNGNIFGDTLYFPILLFKLEHGTSMYLYMLNLSIFWSAHYYKDQFHQWSIMFFFIWLQIFQSDLNT